MILYKNVFEKFIKFDLTNPVKGAIIYLLSDRELKENSESRKNFQEILKKVLTTLKESDIILKLSRKREHGTAS